MLKRTMICASIICMAQSVTLSAQTQGGDSVSLENSPIYLQAENSIPNQVAQVDDSVLNSSPQESTLPDDDSVDDQVLNSENINSVGTESIDRVDSANSDNAQPAQTLGPAVTFDKVSGAVVGTNDTAETETSDSNTIGTPGTAVADSVETDNSENNQFTLNELSAAIEQDKRTLNEQVQKLKEQVLELNKDLFILEEELLFPANTQVAVFVSMNVGDFFQLDAVKLTINEKVVTNYLYTSKQVDALYRGGVQRLYLGNLKTGEHEIVAVFTGRGPKNRDYRRAATLQFEKTAEVKKIELKIVDSTATQQPEFVVKEW